MENKTLNILYVPANFITSERYYQARTTIAAGKVDIRGKTLKDWFLASDNIIWMAKQFFLFYIRRDHGKYYHKWPFFKNYTQNMMEEYADKNKIYSYVEDPISVYTFGNLYKYYIEALSKVNRDFYNTHLQNYDDTHSTELPDYNPYRANIIVGTKNELQNDIAQKSMVDMIYFPEQMRQIDVWQDYDIIRANSNFRYNNEIPIWQNLNKSRIGLDRDNEGLHAGNPDRASLNNLSRGYIMDDVLKYNSVGGTDNKKNIHTGSYV